MKKIITGIVAYIIVGFLVFGWTYNHYRPRCYIGEHPVTHQQGDWCTNNYEADRFTGATGLGILWGFAVPVFLGGVVIIGLGTLAINVTKWP